MGLILFPRPAAAQGLANPEYLSKNGEGGPGRDVDLSVLEQVALEAARGLTEGTLAVLLEQQAGALGEQQPCPACGQLCRVEREPRPVHLRSGQAVPLAEPVCHCPACRRDFFPPAARLASGRPRLQPGDAPPDR